MFYFSIHLWDFCDDSTIPMISVPFRDKTVTSMSLSSMRKHQNTYVVSDPLIVDSERKIYSRRCQIRCLG